MTTLSNQICMSRSQNKHNRIFMQAEPLPEELIDAIDNRLRTSKMDIKDFNKLLVDDFKWD